MNLLIVDNKSDFSKEIIKELTNKHYRCVISQNYNLAEKALQEQSFDVIVVNLKSIDINGISFIEKTKRNKSLVGLIAISSNNGIETCINALESGADDFIIKPFHFSELDSRIKVLTKRKEKCKSDCIVFNEISIDKLLQRVCINGHYIVLTELEYNLLLYFIVNSKKIITKAALSQNILGNHRGFIVSNEIIYTHVKNLRKKLIASGSNDYIQSVYGIGYKFYKK